MIANIIFNSCKEKQIFQTFLFLIYHKYGSVLEGRANMLVCRHWLFYTGFIMIVILLCVYASVCICICKCVCVFKMVYPVLHLL